MGESGRAKSTYESVIQKITGPHTRLPKPLTMKGSIPLQLGQNIIYGYLTSFSTMVQ